jgi:hypothetical protein
MNVDNECGAQLGSLKKGASHWWVELVHSNLVYK